MNAATSDAKPIAIVAIRPDGRRVLFARVQTMEQADVTIAALARIKLRAEIATDVDPKATPGTKIQPNATSKKPRDATRGRRKAKANSQCASLTIPHPSE